MPTQLDYVCLRTLNPLGVDFFNLYFGPEKLERMVGSTKAYVEDHFDNYSSYQTTVAHELLWHLLSFFRICRLCDVLLGQQTGTRTFCSDCKKGGKTTPLCIVISQENQCCHQQSHSAECDDLRMWRFPWNAKKLSSCELCFFFFFFSFFFFSFFSFFFIKNLEIASICIGIFSFPVWDLSVCLVL